MTAFADGAARNDIEGNVPAVADEAYLGDGDFTKVMEMVNPRNILKGIELNPPLPARKRAPWQSAMTTNKYNESVSTSLKGPNREGFIVADPVSLKEVYGATSADPFSFDLRLGSAAGDFSGSTSTKKDNWIPRTKGYGFRFLFNPTTFTEAYSRRMDVEYISYLRVITEREKPFATVNTGTSVGFKLLLARKEDMHILRRSNYADYYAAPITPEQRDNILTMGTMSDIEYLFRITNGDPFETWRGKSSNWGMLLPMAVNVFLGDSAGSRKIRGVITNVSWAHQEFAPGMIPVYTEVALSITRIPDNYSEELPDASTLIDPTGQPVNADGYNGKTVDLPSIKGWKIPTSYNSISSPYGWRFNNTDFHVGIDLGSGTVSREVVAAKAGTVITSGGDSGGTGNWVQIDHGKVNGKSLVTEYMHFRDKPEVRVGQKVKAGQRIGWTGRTGKADGIHLHFGIRFDGVNVDPQDVIDFPAQVGEPTP